MLLSERVKNALQLVSVKMPGLSGLAHSAKVHITSDVESAGIFASGRMLISPTFAEALSQPQLTFLIAHELLHVALKTHLRGQDKDSYLFNAAHDMLINDIVEHALGVRTPADGLRYWRNIPGPPPKYELGFVLTNARLLSAERIFEELKQKSEREKKRLQQKSSDVLGAEQERQWFSPRSSESSMSSDEQIFAESLKGLSPPWEKMTQHTTESGLSRVRTFSRASRRGDRDYVASGRARTSGLSMTIVVCVKDVPQALLLALQDSIGAFCQQNDITRVRLLRIDQHRFLDLDVERARLDSAKKRRNDDKVKRIEAECEAKLLDCSIEDVQIEPEILVETILEGTGSIWPEPALDRLQLEPEVASVVVVTKGLHPDGDKKRPFAMLYVCLRCLKWFYSDVKAH
jgi:hypothetical protein